MSGLLAVDVGLRCGLARYGPDGMLVWYTSRHFGSPGQLRRGIASLLSLEPAPAVLVAEGDGNLAVHWERAARARGLHYRWVQAQDWRPALLLPRERRSGARAKEAAIQAAREVILESGLGRPLSLRHDTAEAILVGLWAARELGWRS